MNLQILLYFWYSKFTVTPPNTTQDAHVCIFIYRVCMYVCLLSTSIMCHFCVGGIFTEDFNGGMPIYACIQ